MIAVADIAKEQYAFVQESRKILLDYCKAILLQDLINENSSFGHGGSIRNLLVHIANCYQEWIANRVLKKNCARLEYDTCKDMDDLVKLFLFVDKFMSEFFERPENFGWEIEYEKDGMIQSASPFKIFSHVITHEYHHKGQILSMSRHLGYIPVDTDILR